MGIVFGDIGTSPLYALSVAAKVANPDGQVSPQAVLGVVSLIFWSLIIVISIKYAILIMRADNHGEGGILALLALISPRRAKQSSRRAVMVVIGLIGATLLYGDGTITPAISVLSAIEGIKVYAPQMGHAVVPLVFLGFIAASLGALLLLPPIPQDQNYHRFADERARPSFWFQYELEVNSSIGSENPFNGWRPIDRLLCSPSVAANCGDINSGRPVVAHTV